MKQAEADLATTSAGITDATPLTEATAAYNSAAFALEIAWLKLLADAGCLTDDQQAQAVAKVTEYTTALQTDLQKAGYYKGPVDGIYGPQTVDAVEQLQTDSGLPPTGLVDQATALALDKKLADGRCPGGEQSLTQTAALQTVLKLTGYWTGPIDGTWTPELTDALEAVPDRARRAAHRQRRCGHLGGVRTGTRQARDRGDHDHDRRRRRRPRPTPSTTTTTAPGSTSTT